MKPDKLTADLCDVLEKEHAALIQGQIASLDQLTRQKEALLVRLSTEAPPAAKMADLSAKIARNQKLLRGAIEGVNAARQKLAAYADVKKGSVVYGSDGTVSRMTGQTKGVSRNV